MIHGKSQFLCPTRNTNRYDVCITKEQLCDHIRDCPEGEDEDPQHCMFYQPVSHLLELECFLKVGPDPTGWSRSWLNQ